MRLVKFCIKRRRHQTTFIGIQLLSFDPLVFVRFDIAAAQILKFQMEPILLRETQANWQTPPDGS